MVVASPTDPACAPPGHSPEAHIRALPSTPLTPKSTTENKTKEQKPHHSTRGRAWEDRGHQSRKVNDTFITNASGRSQVCCASCSANSVCVWEGGTEKGKGGAKGHIGRAGAEGKSVERGCAVMVTAPCTAIDHSRKVSFYPTVKMFIIDVRLGRGGAWQGRAGGKANEPPRGASASVKESKVVSSEGTQCPSGQTERIKVLITLGNREEGGTKKEREKGERRRASGWAARVSQASLEFCHYICPGHRKRYTRSYLIMYRVVSGGRRGVVGGNAAFGGSSVRAGNGEGRKTPCAARNLTSPCEA